MCDAGTRHTNQRAAAWWQCAPVPASRLFSLIINIQYFANYTFRENSRNVTKIDAYYPSFHIKFHTVHSEFTVRIQHFTSTLDWSPLNMTGQTVQTGHVATPTRPRAGAGAGLQTGQRQLLSGQGESLDSGRCHTRVNRGDTGQIKVSRLRRCILHSSLGSKAAGRLSHTPVSSLSPRTHLCVKS